MLYKVTGEQNVVEVAPTTMPDEALYESQVEDWVAGCPDILGEKLLVIGRQVMVDGGKDRIDLLGMDENGSLVVIELKRDLVGGDADLQGLRYASLVQDWGEEEIQRQAEGYWESAGEDRDFLEEVQALCGDEATLNTTQRVILVGRDVKPRLGSMVLWLIAQGVDLKVVAVNFLKDEERIYLQPQVVIPPPAEPKAGGGPAQSKKPWLIDPEAWHLEKRCGPKGRAIFERVMELIAEAAPAADGPNWPQKLYVSWTCNGKGWSWLHSGANRVVLDIRYPGMLPGDAAAELGYAIFDEGAELKDKFALGSSVGGHGDQLRVTIKSDEDVSGDAGARLKRLLAKSWMSISQ
jgi:hypothetical protein